MPALTLTVGLLLGNGDGTFQRPLTFNSGGSYPYSIALADLNGDGRQDVVAVNESSSTVGVLLAAGVLSSTSTSLSSSLNPAIYGQSVTWTAKVKTTGRAPLTGTVRFTWGDTIGSAKLDSSGVAKLTRSDLNADAYPLTAVYSGDVNNKGSTSAVLNQAITQATSATAITSSVNPSTQGQAVTFTATVTSPTVNVTGLVTFLAGKTRVVTAQLNGGKAKYTTSALAVGSTTITSTYDGDSNVAQSSASVSQTVH